MTLKELWEVSPQNFIFVVDGKNIDDYRGDLEFKGLVRTEYNGEKYGEEKIVDRVIAQKYPMYDHVIEVICK